MKSTSYFRACFYSQFFLLMAELITLFVVVMIGLPKKEFASFTSIITVCILVGIFIVGILLGVILLLLGCIQHKIEISKRKEIIEEDDY